MPDSVEGLCNDFARSWIELQRIKRELTERGGNAEALMHEIEQGGAVKVIGQKLIRGKYIRR